MPISGNRICRLYLVISSLLNPYGCITCLAFLNSARRDSLTRKSSRNLPISSINSLSWLIFACWRKKSTTLRFEWQLSIAFWDNLTKHWLYNTKYIYILALFHASYNCAWWSRKNICLLCWQKQFHSCENSWWKQVVRVCRWRGNLAYIYRTSYR